MPHKRSNIHILLKEIYRTYYVEVRSLKSKIKKLEKQLKKENGLQETSNKTNQKDIKSSMRIVKKLEYNDDLCYDVENNLQLKIDEVYNSLDYCLSPKFDKSNIGKGIALEHIQYQKYSLDDSLLPYSVPCINHEILNDNENIKIDGNEKNINNLEYINISKENIGPKSCLNANYPSYLDRSTIIHIKDNFITDTKMIVSDSYLPKISLLDESKLVKLVPSQNSVINLGFSQFANENVSDNLESSRYGNKLEKNIPNNPIIFSPFMDKLSLHYPSKSTIDPNSEITSVAMLKDDGFLSKSLILSSLIKAKPAFNKIKKGIKNTNLIISQKPYKNIQNHKQQKLYDYNLFKVTKEKERKSMLNSSTTKVGCLDNMKFNPINTMRDITNICKSTPKIYKLLTDPFNTQSPLIMNNTLDHNKIKLNRNVLDSSQHLNNGNLPINIMDEILLEQNSCPINTVNSNSQELNEKHLSNDSFDMVPKKKYESTIKQKGDAVRKLSQKQKLNSYACPECKQYYDFLHEGHTDNRDQTHRTVSNDFSEFLKNNNCRHKVPHLPPSTPEHFWEIGMPDTQECRERGYIKDTQRDTGFLKRPSKTKISKDAS